MADQDYSFMRNAGRIPMGALDISRAVQQDPYWRLNIHLKQQQLEMTRWAMREKAYNMELAKRQRQGMAEIGGLLSEPGFSFDNEDYENRFWGIVGRYGFTDDVTKPYAEKFNVGAEVRRNKESRDELARAAGDAGLVPTEMGQDYYGRPRMTYGVPGAVDGKTTAVIANAQRAADLDAILRNPDSTSEEKAKADAELSAIKSQIQSQGENIQAMFMKSRMAVLLEQFNRDMDRAETRPNALKNYLSGLATLEESYGGGATRRPSGQGDGGNFGAPTASPDPGSDFNYNPATRELYK